MIDHSSELAAGSAREFQDVFGSMGVCHICRNTRPVKLCDLCNHYLCLGCRLSPKRATEAAKELLFGRIDGCCGPDLVR